ncbi:hypothetical protein NMG60_11021014, partial [Bertholletia excelsa]
MTRKKVKLAFITNDSARKATFKKRKKGLMKKVSELSTLCGVDACAIIYSPYEPLPEVWPSNLGVQRVLAQFKRMPEMEQSKKMVNQEGFIKQRIAKASDQLKKQVKDNREKEMTEVMFQYLAGRGIQHLTLADLHDLSWLIDQNLKEVCKKIESLKKATVPQAGKVPFPPAPAPPTGGHGGESGLEAMQRPQWTLSAWMGNGNEHAGFGGEDAAAPFGENPATSVWPGSFFP